MGLVPVTARVRRVDKYNRKVYHSRHSFLKIKEEKRIEMGKGIVINDSLFREFDRILTPCALDFIVYLHRRFSPGREFILNFRKFLQTKIDKGEMPNFLEETSSIRNDPSWSAGPLRQDLQKRWVEITGPAGDRKMVINALNSGADVYMADFEDSQSPTFHGLVSGQLNLYESVRRTISFDHPKKGKIGLSEKTATLMVRPRGWHLSEEHLIIDGKPIPGALFDFGLFLYHNAEELIRQGSGPYFYLPKLENYGEALFWNEIFTESELYLGIPHGSIKATVLIESILAAFQAEEILWALKDHSAGENVGRWDYIASFGKKFRNHPEFVLPDRGAVTMDQHFMKSYVDYVIKVCHRRGAHAIGGMAAQIPIKGNPEANEVALAKVKADKEREVNAGHDGTWVAHPDLVSVARIVFAEYLGDKPNQIDFQRSEVNVTAQDLLAIPEGVITEEGLREDINAFVKYVAGWLSGIGAVAIDYYDKKGKLYAYLMEDAATAEIARTQVWKWIHQDSRLKDGRVITARFVRELLLEEIIKIQNKIGQETFERSNYTKVAELFMKMVTEDDFADYLTLPAYQILLDLEKEKKEAGFGR